MCILYIANSYNEYKWEAKDNVKLSLNFGLLLIRRVGYIHTHTSLKCHDISWLAIYPQTPYWFGSWFSIVLEIGSVRERFLGHINDFKSFNLSLNRENLSRKKPKYDVFFDFWAIFFSPTSKFGPLLLNYF